MLPAATEDPDNNVATVALNALGKVADARVEDRLLRFLVGERRTPRDVASFALALTGDQSTFVRLEALLTNLGTGDEKRDIVQGCAVKLERRSRPGH